MTFDAATYNLLAIAVALILGFAVFFLAKLIWQNQKNPRIAALAITFLITWVILYNSGTEVMVIRGEGHKEWVVIGNSIEIDGANYKLQNETPSGKFIINKTGQPLVFESLDYGDPSIPRISFDRVFLFEPDSMENRSDFPDYFPWQPAPTSVSVMKGIKSDSKEWIRYATPEELARSDEQERVQEWNEEVGAHDLLIESFRQSEGIESN